MAIDLTHFLSNNAKNMRRSAIRDLLNVANKPEIISFAGGFPNALTFPVEDLKAIMTELMEEMPEKLLQYGPTTGSIALRKQIAKKYGLKDACGIAAGSSPLYLPNNMLREFFAEIKFLVF